jgi:CelD/BcsL family acetyltransferase involved in cellulose biosynthesis
VRGELLVDLGVLEGLQDEWDELVDAAGRPFASPAWLLAWWRCAAPPGAGLRVAVARDGDRLVAVAPFFSIKGRSGLETIAPLATRVSHRCDPVGLPGREREAAAALASVLSGTGAQVVRFEAVAVSSPWVRALAEAWPGAGRPRLYREDAVNAPYVSLSGRDLDDWLRSRSSNFRSAMGRHIRRADELGATVRLANGVAEAKQGVRELARLHAARWAPRGGSGVIDEAVEAMLVDSVEGLLARNRLRLYLMEVDGRVVGADLFLAAGGETSYWLGGFDDDFAHLAPSLRNIYEAVAGAFEQRGRRLDLGAGEQAYKYRFADGEERLEWWVLVPRGRRSIVARAQVVGRRARRVVGRRLSPRQKTLLRRILRRR